MKPTDRKNEPELASHVTTKAGLAGVRNIIAIASGKGGVGKSTVATNLAVALKQTGATVGLMDADIYGPSQPGMLGANNAQLHVEGNNMLPVSRFGVSFISMGLLMGDDSPVIWRAPMAMKIIQQFITNVEWGELDYLLIDLPPGTGDVQLTLAQQASLTGAVIVTTPQEVALGVARKGLKMFEQVNVPILGVIENMSGFLCKHCGKETAIFKTGGGKTMAERLGVPYLGSIPLDPEIMMSGDSGKPVLENGNSSAAASAFLNVAANLQQNAVRINALTSAIEPEEIKIIDNGRVTILWPDGHQGIHKAYSLRVGCPCASCVDEDSGDRIVDPKRIPLNIQVMDFTMIGRYAVALKFTDGHSTGLYAFKYLREMCECDNCRGANQSLPGSFSV